MATLTIPHAFVAGTPALASEVNANFQAVVSWTQGQISTDNLGILGARSVALPSSPTFAILSLSQTSSNIALNISNSGTESALAINQSGALANGKGAILINSPSNQTTAGAAEILMTLNTNSSIPALLVKHGAVETFNLSRTQLQLFGNTTNITSTAISAFSNALSLSASALTLFSNAVEISNARIKLPVRTTTERNVVTQEGSILYNTTDKTVQYRDNSGWRDFTPSGIIQMYAGNVAPQGWLYCNGAVVSQTTYATLFAAIGSTYNTGGEGAGNFRLPNFVGIFPRGSAMDGVSSQTISAVNYTGQALNTKQADAFMSHTHYVHQRDNGDTHTEYPGFDGGGNGAMVWRSGLIGGGDQAVAGTLRSGRADANETRPANIAIAFIIKA